MSRFNLIALGVLCAVAGLCICGGPAAAGPIGSVFNPMDYTTLDAGGGLTMSAVDTITFDTSSGAITGTIGGSPVSFGNGFTASSQSTGVQVRVFTFDSINIASGATVNVTGDLGLVLASQSDFTLNAPLIGLDGSDANLQTGGAGGPGAEGGTPGGSFGSTPPGSTRGNGGDGAVAVANGWDRCDSGCRLRRRWNSRPPHRTWRWRRRICRRGRKRTEQRRGGRGRLRQSCHQRIVRRKRRWRKPTPKLRRQYPRRRRRWRRRKRRALRGQWQQREGQQGADGNAGDVGGVSTDSCVFHDLFSPLVLV